jgi:hypothetical protein
MAKKGLPTWICCSLSVLGRGLAADSNSIWDQTINLRGAVGFKDNILLSKVQNDQSAFLESSFDLLVFRLPLDGTTFSFFGTFDDRRYFSSPSVHKEETAAANVNVSHAFGAKWEAGLELQYAYTDEILDASVTEVDLTSVLVRSHSISGTPYVIRKLPWETWIRLEYLTERDFYKRPLDDFWEIGPKLIFGKNFGYGSVVSLSYFFHQRAYDNRQDTALDFTRIPDTSLRFRQNEVEAQVRINWDEAKHWRTRLRASWGLNEDNGPGFYDYNKVRVAGRFGYHAKTWNLTLEGKAVNYDYVVQPLIDGTGERNRWDYVVGTRLEKNLTEKLKLFVESEHEWAISNEHLEQYEVNTVMAGVDYEF